MSSASPSRPAAPASARAVRTWAARTWAPPCALPRLGSLLALLGLLLVAGCGVEETGYPPNQPPHTRLWIESDSLNTTLYHTILSWSGNDVDGDVIGFAYRWSEPWQPGDDDSLWWEDPNWTFTTAYVDTFDVPIRGSFAERTFSVRAIDNAGLADPDPATQRFPLRNAPPEVSWTDVDRHPTDAHPSLPAISFAFTPEDYNGRETIDYARTWLDIAPGEDSTASTVIVRADTVAAFFPEHFQGRHGRRTVYLQVFDRAETGSDTISWSWTVVPPTGEYLLIDGAWPDGEAAAFNQDRFWNERMEALFPGNYHVYDMEIEGPFRSRAEVLPLFSLFKGIVWYGIQWFDESQGGGGSAEQDAVLREALALAQEALLPYAAEGGAILITAHNVLGTRGGLSSSYVERTFGVEAIHRYFEDEELLSDFSLPRRTMVQLGSWFGETDSLLVRNRVPHSDYFRLAAEREPLIWLRPGAAEDLLGVFPQHADEVFSLGAVADTAGGHVAIATTLLTYFHPSSEAEPAVEAFLRRLFALR